MASLGSTARSALLVTLTGALGATALGCHHGSSDPYTPDRVATIKAQLKYHHVAVHPYTITKKVEDPGTAPQECHDATVDFLKSKSIFASVDESATDNAADTLLADAEIEDLRIVGGAARFWVGAMAGSSYMHIKLTLRDASNNAVVFERFVESDNNAFGAAYSWGASDRNLPSNVGVALADMIVHVAEGQPPPVQAQ